MNDPHVLTQPAILYFGTPVVLKSTLNEDGTANLAPMSSAFWLGWRCLLGLNATSRTSENMIRTGECVLNLPSENEVGAVDNMAMTTGSNPVPANNVQKGYNYEPHKFERAGLSPLPSLSIKPPRALECPVQMEARVADRHGVNEDNPALRGFIDIFEVEILKVHALPSIPDEGWSQSHRSRRVEALDNELPEVLWPCGGSASHLEARRDSGGDVSRSNSGC